MSHQVIDTRRQNHVIDNNKDDRLYAIRTRMTLLEAHFQKPSMLKVSDYNPNERQFVPPSPIFSFIHRYPRIAGFANQCLYWDTNLCIQLNQLSTRISIATFFKIISRLGDGWFWYAMLIASIIIGGWAKLHLVLATILTSLLGVSIYKLLKVKTVRPRPYQVHQVIKLGERPLDVFSFPSGHTMQAVLFTSTLGYFFPEFWWIMAPFAMLVALSRMILGLHYPTDVLVGAILGFCLSFLAPSFASIIHDLFQNVLGF